MSEVMKYTKKPIVIEAIEFTGENFDEIKEFGGGFVNVTKVAHPNGKVHRRAIVITPSGEVELVAGAFVCTQSPTDFWPIPGDIFRETYDQVE